MNNSGVGARALRRTWAFTGTDDRRTKATSKLTSLKIWTLWILIRANTYSLKLKFPSLLMTATKELSDGCFRPAHRSARAL